MALTGKKVLVTGGAGFIGSHFVENLLDENSDVIVQDSAGHQSNSYFFKKNLYDKVVFEPYDITDFYRTHSIITKHKVDYVIHAGAQALVDTAYVNPLETINSNVVGTANVLEACRLYGKVSGVLVTSTDKAYGKLPRVDENKPVSGDHPYEASKASADLIARSYFKTYGLPVVVTRFGNVYGEGDLNFSRIIPGIMKSIVRAEQLQIRSDGKYIRDYVYVKDVVDASFLLMKNIKKTQGEAFNISSLENMSVLGLIKKAEAVLGVRIDYRILSNAKNEIPVQSVNFGKIKKALGWKPKNSLKSTLSAILDWYGAYFENI